MSESEHKHLLIGELANLAGVKADSVRFYERSGLLPKPERTSAGYRSYDDAALKRLRFIKKAQALGFSLAEIHRTLSLHGQGAATCCRVIAMAEATLSETDEKLKQLQKFRDALAANLHRWRRASSRDKVAAEFCALIESSDTA